MSLECNTSLLRCDLLKDRARMLHVVRSFFFSRSVMEVDCPSLSRSASVDAHIDLVQATCLDSKAFLHSSPEYPMKRLLSEGVGDIYQLSHVFRDGECGAKHNPEFMMVEWYRLGFSLQEMIVETFSFVELFLGVMPKKILSYRKAFLQYAHIDPFEASIAELLAYVHQIDPLIQSDDRDELLNYILALQVEPHLGKGELVALSYFPPSQAALAKTTEHEGVRVAERFEVYVEGVELANGYHELQDAKEQLLRLEESNTQRVQLKKAPLPIDYHFIEALNKGIPTCSGVAVGFDRLMMLRHKQKEISAVMPFSWQNA